MTNLLIKTFIKDPDNVLSGSVRSAYGKLAGIVGIVCNIILFIAKLAAGLLFGSVSVTADAINNLSDASSSIVTLIGFKLGEKPADKDHPFGHARMEYLSGLAVAVMILVIGVELIKTSVEKIIHPSDVEFTVLTAAVLILSIAVKLWMSLFNKTLGKKICSSALEATAADCRNDVLSTGVVLLAGIISVVFDISIDGYAGLLVAVFILISGIGIAKETIDPILGCAPDESLVDYIRQKVEAYDDILGMHDLYIHDYGPGRRFASCHVEIDRNIDPLCAHDLIDNIERCFMEDDCIQLVIHYDPVVTDDEELNTMKAVVLERIHSIDPRLSIHDFRMVRGFDHTNLIFDMVIPSEFQCSTIELTAQVNDAVQMGDMKYYAVIDYDIEYFN
ncbi:MAG: cation transporter [Ruminococcaceae bacterium]|nr:cation transporter [Oscillospiraceae bacterium]